MSCAKSFLIFHAFVLCFIAVHGQNAGADFQCHKPMSKETYEMFKTPVIVHYMIGPTKLNHTVSCFIGRVKPDNTEDDVSYSFKVNEQTQSLHASFLLNDDGYATLKISDPVLPSGDMNVEVLDNGIFVAQLCNAADSNSQTTVIAQFSNGKDMSKEAGDVAKTYTANPDDYKVDEVKCS